MTRGKAPGGKRAYERIAYLDYMRVIATFAIVVLHCSAQNWGNVPVESLQWQIFNLYDSAVRWGVPVFVMISGAVFLNRAISVGQLFRRHILRMTAVYFTWSFLYAIAEGGGIMQIMKNTLQGHYHMWFIPMIIGLYMTVPIMRLFIKNDFHVRYFLILSLIFAFIIPNAITILMDFGGEDLSGLALNMKNAVGNLYLNMPKGYACYFLLGYWLDKVVIGEKAERTIYALGIAGFVLTVFMSVALSLKSGAGSQNYYNEFTLNVLFESMAVFVFFKNAEYGNVRMNDMIFRISRHSFGAYLVYAFIMDFLNSFLNLNTLAFNAVMSVPVLSLAVFSISIMLSALLKKMPFLNRYMV